MAEEVITRFTGDVGPLEDALDKAEAAVGDYQKSAEGGVSSTDKLGKSVGNLSARTQVLVTQQQNAKKASAEGTQQATQQAAATDSLSKSQQGAAKSAEQLGKATRQATQEGQRLGGLSAIVERVRGSFGRLTAGAGNLLRSITSAFRGGAQEGQRAGGVFTTISQQVQQAAGSVPVLGRAISALSGPIGFAASAVAGLVFNFSKLDTVQDRINEIKAGFSTFFAALRGNASLSDTIDAIGAAVDRTRELDRINTAAIANQVQVSQLRAEAAELQRQSRNKVVAEEERVKLLERSNTLLEQASQISLTENTDRAKVAYQDLVATIILENKKLTESQRAQLKSFTDLSVEAAKVINDLDTQGFNIDQQRFDAAAKLSAKRIGDESEITLQRERNNNFIAALQDQSARDEEARQQKAAQEAQRRYQEEVRRIEQLNRLREQSARLRTQLERDQFRDSLAGQPRAQALFDVEVRGLDQIEEANRLFDEQVKLAKGNAAEIARIEAERGATITAIRQATNTKLEAIDADYYQKAEAEAEQARQRIIDAARDPLDVQASQIEAKYDELLAMLEKFITDEDELLALRNALNAKRNAELNALDKASVEQRSLIIERIESFTRSITDNAAQYLIDRQDESREAIERINRDYADQIKSLEKFAQSEEQINGERVRLEEERNRQIENERKRASKAFLRLLLDTLQKELTIAITEVAIAQTAKGAKTGGVVGALAGAAQAAIVAAVLNGLFSGLRSIIGAYQGDEFIGRNERPVMAGRDGYLRRLDYGERVITAKDNRKYWEVLDAIHRGKYDQWKERNMSVTYHVDAPRQKSPMVMVYPERGWEQNNTAIHSINNYLSSDTGQRTATSVMLAKYYDRNIVDGLTRTQREQRKTNELLAAMLSTQQLQRSGRYW